MAGCYPPPGCTLQEAQLQQVGLIDIHNGIGLLTDRSGDSVQPHRAAVEFLDDSQKHLMVQLIQPQVVHFKPGESLKGNIFGNYSLSHHLGVIPDPPEEAICYPRCTPGAARDLLHSTPFRFNPHDTCRALDDCRNSLHIIEIEAVHNTKPVPERCAEHGEASSCTDQGKTG